LSIGFDIGRLKSGSTGLSFVAEFSYSGGTVTNEYTSEAFAYATGAQAILLPQVNIPASTIPTFPTITATLNTTNRKITVTAAGGNVTSTILVFVK
jgi:hypothetical protein